MGHGPLALAEIEAHAVTEDRIGARLQQRFGEAVDDLERGGCSHNA